MILRVARKCLVLCMLVVVALGGGEAGTRSSSTQSPSISSRDGKSSPVSTATALKHAASIKQLNTATCPTGTVNYITHTLPQQCLRIGRSSTALSNSTDVGIASPRTSSDAKIITPNVGTANPEASHVGSTSGELGVTPSQSTGDVSSAIAQATSPSVESQPSEDVESALDNANFLSFEEWKIQNLEKVGQSPENIGRSQSTNGNRQRPDLMNALDTLGEENEIDLDFTGFGGGNVNPETPSSQSASTSAPGEGSLESQGPASLVTRSKDAGKTCKERTNYASFDCAATALKSNKECKSSSAILVENKDNYMLNICSAKNKFIIIELCDDILVDTVVLANYEFFSSSFRHFRISVSDRYPVKMEKWKNLGTYEARNTREVQAFLVENPLIWARYLRVEFLTHYGSEYYCPVSLLRVHGTTMLEEFRHQEDVARGEDDEASIAEVVVTSPIVNQVDGDLDTRNAASVTVGKSSEHHATSGEMISQTQETLPAMDHKIDSMPTASLAARPANTTLTVDEVCVSPHAILDATCSVSRPLVAATRSPAEASDRRKSMDISDMIETTSSVACSSSASPKSSPISTDDATSKNGDIADMRKGSQTSQPQIVSNQTIPVTMSSNGSSTSTGQTSSSPPPPLKAVLNATASTNTSRVIASSSSNSHPAQPSTQESFFKSVHKRLQQLESNSTLSLKYIEEQSRILRDAFSKVEKRQLATTTTFLSSLNVTVMSELNGFRQAYDQLWQSTVIELDGQRQQNQRELLALSTRLTMIANELVWQKRMGILQSTLLLFCLVLVLFGRTGSAYLEMPMMQQMMNRSSAALRSGWESPPMSPSPDSRSPVSMFRRKLWGSSPEPTAGGPSDSEKEGGPEIRFEPPTPPGHREMQDEIDSDSEYYEDEDDLDELDQSVQAQPEKDGGLAAQALESLPNGINTSNNKPGQAKLTEATGAVKHENSFRPP